MERIKSIFHGEYVYKYKIAARTSPYRWKIEWYWIFKTRDCKKGELYIAADQYTLTDIIKIDYALFNKYIQDHKFLKEEVMISDIQTGLFLVDESIFYNKIDRLILRYSKFIEFFKNIKNWEKPIKKFIKVRKAKKLKKAVTNHSFNIV